MTEIEAAELVLSRTNPWDDCATCDGYGMIWHSQKGPHGITNLTGVSCRSCRGGGRFMPGPLKRAYKLLKLKKPKHPGPRPIGQGGITITSYDS